MKVWEKEFNDLQASFKDNRESLPEMLEPALGMQSDLAFFQEVVARNLTQRIVGRVM